MTDRSDQNYMDMLTNNTINPPASRNAISTASKEEGSAVKQFTDLTVDLENATRGLTYPSESDEPYTVVQLEYEKSTLPSDDEFPAIAAQENPSLRGKRCRSQTLDEFMASLENHDYQPQKEQYKRLREVLRGLKEVRVYRVGERAGFEDEKSEGIGGKIWIYILGYVDGVGLMGVKTLAIAT
ncbi:uncharacterized protein VTP21DRAFT_485 [Calcarisporiella thermophila]|uniref:uncharacterized protein n=1 Tax=Calcarisporiella thermophila TaxID=911321 RepID=UPI003742EE92